MQRRREVAAAPERTTSETSETISDLIRDSLARAEKIDLTDVDGALATARPAFLALIAGGHLDTHPLVLVAGALHLSMTTVSGDGALTLEENLAAVPGGASASASDWTLYLPTPDPLGPMVTKVAESHRNLSVGEPPAETASAEAASSLVDLDALARRESR
jgi:hypothetical protein